MSGYSEPTRRPRASPSPSFAAVASSSLRRSLRSTGEPLVGYSPRRATLVRSHFYTPGARPLRLGDADAQDAVADVGVEVLRVGLPGQRHSQLEAPDPARPAP